MKTTPVLVLAIAVLLQPQSLLAQEVSGQDINKNDPAVVFARKGDAVLTQESIDAAFHRIPENVRLAFIRDGAKVDRLVQSLLQTELIAKDARSAGFDQSILVQERMKQAAAKELSEAWIQDLASKAPEADYTALAEEDYLAQPDKYRKSVTVDVTHVLIGTKDRSDEEANALAEQLRAQVDGDPSVFDSLVPQYSDDPSKLTNFGRFKGVGPGQMVKPFEDAAFALKEPGQIAGPVKTEFGYHLIRLDARHASELPPFEDVRARAEASVKARHIDEFRTRYIQKLLMEPLQIPEGAVELMLKRWFGENLENAPVFGEDGPE